MDAELESKLEKANEETEKYMTITAQQSGRIGELQRDVRQGSEAVEEIGQELKGMAQSLSIKDKAIRDLRNKLSKSETIGAATQHVLGYVLRWILIPVVVASLIVIGTGLLTSPLELGDRLMSTAVVAVVAIAVVLETAVWRGAKVDGVRRLTWYVKLRRCRRWVYGVLGTVLLGLTSRFIWEFLPSVVQ